MRCFLHLPALLLLLTLSGPTTYNAYLDQVKATPQYQTLQNNIQDQANRVGTISFPFATLLRLGWMF